MYKAIALEAAAPSIINSPVLVTAQTMVGCVGSLYSCHRAGWTGASGVKPVAIGVDHVLDSVLADHEVITRSEDFPGVVPGQAFDLEQVDISFEPLMVEQGVG